MALRHKHQSLCWSVHACERRAITLSRCHHCSGRSTSVGRSSARVTVLSASILYAVTAIHDCDTFKKLPNAWLFNLCWCAWDATQLKSVKLFTKHAPGELQMIEMNDIWQSLWRFGPERNAYRRLYSDVCRYYVGEFQVWKVVTNLGLNLIRSISFIPTVQLRQTCKSPCNENWWSNISNF